MDVSTRLNHQSKSLGGDCKVNLHMKMKILAISTSAFHLSFIETLPCQILQGIAPDEQRWAKELPFFSEKGSAVLILVNFEEGNSVKPVFGFIYSFIKIFASFLEEFVFFTTVDGFTIFLLLGYMLIYKFKLYIYNHHIPQSSRS